MAKVQLISWNRKNGLLVLGILLGFMWGCSKSSSNRSEDTTPQDLGDWAVSSPEEQGLDSAVLERGFAEAERRGFINGIAIVRNGYLVAESYFNGHDANTPQRIMSVSKSFLSALTGIALEAGFLPDLDQKMLDYFPQYVHGGLDERKFDITVQHLLTMRGGIDGERNNYFQLHSSENWIQATLDFPLSFAPGTRFSYNTFLTHLLSGVLTAATEMDMLHFAQTRLCQPTGISIVSWERDPQGICFGGNGMYVTIRDMAKFGLLYLNLGRSNGQQVIPEDWVRASIVDTTGWEGATWGDLHDAGYGFLWWLGSLGGYEAQVALGYGGQFIINFPELNLVIVVTSNANVDWEPADAQERSVLEVVSGHLLPAVV